MHDLWNLNINWWFIIDTKNAQVGEHLPSGHLFNLCSYNFFIINYIVLSFLNWELGISSNLEFLLPFLSNSHSWTHHIPHLDNLVPLSGCVNKPKLRKLNNYIYFSFIECEKGFTFHKRHYVEFQVCKQCLQFANYSCTNKSKHIIKTLFSIQKKKTKNKKQESHKFDGENKIFKM
jgi:hypothetical protein